MTFDPTTNRIQTMHLTADELAALKAAKWGLYVVECSGYLTDLGDKPAAWVGYLVYRAKPAPVTQDVVPWEAIDARFIGAVRHPSGVSAAFTVAPEKGDDGQYWIYKGEILRLSALTGYTPGTCDWRYSLQQRPQPVRDPIGDGVTDDTAAIQARFDQRPQPAATGAVTKPLAEGARYWVAEPTSPQWAFPSEWVGVPSDDLRLSRGLIHLTKAAAVAHAKRMTGVV